MILIFEFSKEYKKLPIDEAIAVLKSEKIKFNIIESNIDLLIISVDIDYKKIKQFSQRLSLTFNIGELLFISNKSINKLKNKALNTKIIGSGTIAVTYRNRSKNTDSQIIVKTLAEIITKNKKVNLNKPDIEIRCLIKNNKIYVSRNIFKIDRNQFEKRKVQNRPFFSPISLHPKLSRVIINLSKVKKHEILLDPFCGTGGVLIEAGFLGIKCIGNDIDNKLVEGCKKNLDYYKIPNYKLYNYDIGKINKFIDKVDAVVTDLPYGKSTTTKGEKLFNLYQRAFKSIYKILKNNGFAVIGLANKNFIEIGQNYLKLENIYEIKVHNSLTRYFVIYKKIKSI